MSGDCHVPKSNPNRIGLNIFFRLLPPKRPKRDKIRLLGSRITLEFAKVNVNINITINDSMKILIYFSLRAPREETGEPPGSQSTGPLPGPDTL